MPQSLMRHLQDPAVVCRRLPGLPGHALGLGCRPMHSLYIKPIEVRFVEENSHNGYGYCASFVLSERVFES